MSSNTDEIMNAEENSSIKINGREILFEKIVPHGSLIVSSMKERPTPMLGPDGKTLFTGMSYSFVIVGEKRDITLTNFVEGRKDGLEITINELGNIVSRYRYVKNRLHGRHEKFYSDGSPSELIVFDSTKSKKGKVLEIKSWLPSGEICSKSKIDKIGNGQIYSYDENSEIEKITYFSNHEIHSIGCYQDGDLEVVELNNKGDLISRGWNLPLNSYPDLNYDD